MAICQQLHFLQIKERQTYNIQLLYPEDFPDWHWRLLTEIISTPYQQLYIFRIHLALVLVYCDASTIQDPVKEGLLQK